MEAELLFGQTQATFYVWKSKKLEADDISRFEMSVPTTAHSPPVSENPVPASGNTPVSLPLDTCS